MAGKVTYGLLFDVQAVLEKHGFKLPEGERERHIALGETLLAVTRLAAVFEGREDA
ncbi:hypothetical protein Nocox_36865 [Nonomuraea coxensis DSM 45129]|uniref:Uncharacterized protein n=1 Tax=Nonomuraea coxensis DSM 45129 TaxID=1122611 RepID=A0ABX8UAX2_9ACTN|nr:hypothetical protein [Nonomuraea coxensis]QYC44927.1 hypothetical protein Nocox_36865 [Nonomuraea coxensis DSM 45129]